MQNPKAPLAPLATPKASNTPTRSFARHPLTMALTGITVALLAACGGGGSSSSGSIIGGSNNDDRTPGLDDGASAQPVTLALLHQAEPYESVSDCQQGGILLSAGLDQNGNHQIEASEIEDARLICNDTQIVSQQATERFTVSEIEAGETCQDGGYDARIGESRYTVCHDNSGARLSGDSSGTLVSGTYTSLATAETGESYKLGINLNPTYAMDATVTWVNAASGQVIPNQAHATVTAPDTAGEDLWAAMVEGPWGSEMFPTTVTVQEDRGAAAAGQVRLDHSIVSYPTQLEVAQNAGGPFVGSMFRGVQESTASTGAGYAVELDDLPAKAVDALTAFTDRLEADGRIAAGSISVGGLPTNNYATGVVALRTSQNYTLTEIVNKTLVMGLSNSGQTYASLLEPLSSEQATQEFRLYVATKTLTNGKTVVTAAITPSFDVDQWDGVFSQFSGGRNIIDLGTLR